MADLFRKPNPDASLFNMPDAMTAMPNAVPTSFEQWKANPENLIKIGQQPEQQQPQAPQAQPQQAPQPTANAPQTAYGDPVDANPAPVPQAAQGIMPNRPQLPQLSRGQNIGMALATLADSIGSSLTHTPATVGPNRLNTISDIQSKQREYDQNQPKLAYDLNQLQTRNTLGNEATAASTAHTIQETKNIAGQLSPIEQRKAQFVTEMQKEAESGKYSPEALAAKIRRTADYNKIAMSDDEIKGLVAVKPVGAKYTVKTGEKGVFEGLSDKQGNFYAPNQIPNDPEAQSLAQSAQGIHKQLVNEEVDKESRVAGYAADRAATANQRALDASDVKKGKEMSAKHLESLRAAENQNELVQKLASSKSPTDQTSLAFKALGLDLPDGVHRINEAELNAIRSQGSLSDRAEKALLNWSKGQQFAPEILKDIAQTANTISQSKIKNANDNLDDIERIYGYKAPRGGKSQSGGIQVGQSVKLKSGQVVKVTAVHPDGSFDY